MTNELFEKLINSNESNILDFKKEEYDFSSSAKEIKKAEFIKDIISFTNTIRENTSYIIIGIEETENGLRLNGINKTTDDSILQQKIKNNTFPIPKFSYYPFNYQNKKFGIIEFPIEKYDKPISVTKAFRGLTPGKIYFRRNSCNDEANSLEVIEINNWITNSINQPNTVEILISNTLEKLSLEDEKLSKTIIDLYSVSKKHNLETLKEFCKNEINGYESVTNSYRTIKVVVPPGEINRNSLSFYSASEIINKLLNEYNAIKESLFFSQSIFIIEDLIINFPSSKSSLLEIPVNYNNQTINSYVEKNTLTTLYQNIKTELIKILINI